MRVNSNEERVEVEISDLVGKKITKVEGLEEGSEMVIIYTDCDHTYMFNHEQICCEDVELNDFECDVEMIVGAKIISADVAKNKNHFSESKDSPNEEFATWTWSFYKIETDKGEIWMRWIGGSNGAYSEEVSIFRVKKEEIQTKPEPSVRFSGSITIRNSY